MQLTLIFRINLTVKIIKLIINIVKINSIKTKYKKSNKALNEKTK